MGLCPQLSNDRSAPVPSSPAASRAASPGEFSGVFAVVETEVVFEADTKADPELAATDIAPSHSEPGTNLLLILTPAMGVTPEALGPSQVTEGPAAKVALHVPSGMTTAPRPILHAIDPAAIQGDLAFSLRVEEQAVVQNLSGTPGETSTSGPEMHAEKTLPSQASSETQPEGAKALVPDPIREESAHPSRKVTWTTRHTAQDPDRSASVASRGAASHNSSDSGQQDSSQEGNPSKNSDGSGAHPSPEPAATAHLSLENRKIFERHVADSEPTREPLKAFAAAAPDRIERIDDLRTLAASQPARQLAVRVAADSIAGSGGPSVDLVVAQRGGGLQFAVHSTDPSMAAELRGSLRELSARLESQGFHAESWTPAAIATNASSESGMSFDSSATPDGNFDGSGQGEHHRERHPSGEERQEGQPDWLAELDRLQAIGGEDRR